MTAKHSNVGLRITMGEVHTHLNIERDSYEGLTDEIPVVVAARLSDISSKYCTCKEKYADEIELDSWDTFERLRDIYNGSTVNESMTMMQFIAESLNSDVTIKYRTDKSLEDAFPWDASDWEYQEEWSSSSDE